MKLLTTEEEDALVLSLAKARAASKTGSRSFTKNDAAKVLGWATEARLAVNTLRAVLEGMLLIDWSDEENDIIFTAPKP